MIRGALLIASLVLAAELAGAQQPAQSDLARLFAAARADTSQVVPLVRAGSRALATLAPDAAAKLGDALEPYCARLFFGPERLAGMEQLGLELHRVAKGETPTKIAASRRCGAKLLEYLNEGFDERRLQIGRELKVLDLASGTLSIEVDTDRYRVFAWRARIDGERDLVLCAPVGLGAATSPTPHGKTTIAKRVLDPQWTHPDTREVIPAGDPRNLLGGYWLALDPSGIGKSGIGFHGYTGAPAADWIQQPASHGCVRMLQRDIDRLFHVALEGTPVVLY